MRMIKFGKTQTRASQTRFYCRHHNRLVACCPREADMEGCPLRRDCPAYERDCAGGPGDPRTMQA